jgi:hypothetical protein
VEVLALLRTRLPIERTFATDDGDLLCLLLESLDLGLSVDRGLEGGSEIVLSVGRLFNGNKLPPGPGLADRERRGQGISPYQFLLGLMPRAAGDLLSLCIIDDAFEIRGKLAVREMDRRASTP